MYIFKNSFFYVVAFMAIFGVVACVDMSPTNNFAPFDKIQVSNVDLTDDVWDGHAISYGGYRGDQEPGGASPSDAEILEDMRILEKKWNLIRFYNSDEHGEAVLRVISSNNIDLKVMLGVFIFETKNLSGNDLAANEAANQLNITEGLRLAKAYSNIVAGINVGNEALVSWSFFANEPSTMIRYIQQVKAGLSTDGLSIPVTLADNYAFWKTADGVTVAAELDFITVHGYGMWDRHGIATALTFLDDQVNAVKANIPNKPIVIGETGWASFATDGQIFNVIGEEGNEVNQRTYFDQILAWSEQNGITTFLFEAFDEPWKGGRNACSAETHWGVFDKNRKAKLVMDPYYPELSTDAQTSPSYGGDECQPTVSANLNLAFRSSVVTQFSIDTPTMSPPEALASISEGRTAYEGSSSILFSHAGIKPGGFFADFAPVLNLSNYNNIVVALSGVPTNVQYFELRLESGDAGFSLNILSHPSTNDGDWKIYTIPFSSFTGVDFSSLDGIGFWHPFDRPTHPGEGNYVASSIFIDDIHFE